MTASKIEQMRDALIHWANPHKVDELLALVRSDERNKVEQSIGDALDTAERGEALVDVARAAHRAELELAAVELEDASNA